MTYPAEAIRRVIAWTDDFDPTDGVTMKVEHLRALRAYIETTRLLLKECANIIASPDYQEKEDLIARITEELT